MSEQTSVWRPIEIAPKDGRDILLCGGTGSGRWRRVGYWGKRAEAWVIDCVVELSAPTHWMEMAQPFPSVREPQETQP